MAIVPQESYIFSGSLRFNIDPFQKFSDNQIMQILEKICFAKTLQNQDNILQDEKVELSKLKSKSKLYKDNINMDQFKTQESSQFISNNTIHQESILEFKINDAGKNLSIGQKQLICIARALIQKPEILLMDEATSNIDEYTDKIIQNMIRNEFKDTTIGKEIILINL